MNERAADERRAALIIHGFMIAGTTLGMIPAIGLMPLTIMPLILAMLSSLASLCGSESNVKRTGSIVMKFAGYALSASVAGALTSLLPIIGNLANAAISAASIEIIGWAAFYVLRDTSDDAEDVNMGELLQQAQKLRKENKLFMEKLNEARKSMDSQEQKQYDADVKMIADKNATAKEREEALNRIQELLVKYDVEL